MDAHADRRGLLLGYVCNGVWRYLDKRRRSNQSTFSFSVFSQAFWTVETIHIQTNNSKNKQYDEKILRINTTSICNHFYLWF